MRHIKSLLKKIDEVRFLVYNVSLNLLRELKEKLWR